MSLLDFFGVTEPAALMTGGDPFDDRWYSESIGHPTAAGVRVDENTAFNYSVCWAATRLLAGTAGWLPFNLYKRKSGGGAEIDAKHRTHRLIHSQPNRDMGSMMFRSRGVNHQVNWGNTYSEIVRDDGGRPVVLEPIHPRRIPIQNIRREDGRIVYYVKRPDGIGQPQRVLQENMFHVPSIISEDGIIGKGVVTAARESIGKAMGTQRRGAATINNGGAPPLALKGKSTSFKNKEEMKEYRRQLYEQHGGPENAGKWLLLPPDTEVQLLGFSLEDSQFIESENFDVEEIARWYGVPPHLVGHLLRATFNNIEELGISFVKYSLIQWLKLWEQEVWRKLLTPAEQETHYAKFVVDALERGNLATRTEAGVKKFFNGLWTLNQWSEQEDMNPVTETVEIDGETVNLGDVRFVQQAMIPLAMAAKGEGLQKDQQEKPATPDSTTDEPKEEPPPEDEGLKAVRSEVATIAASSATLSMSVERIVVALGAMQGEVAAGREEQRQLTTSMNQQQTLLTTIQTSCEANATATQELRGGLDRQAEYHQQLAATLLRDVRARLLSVEINAIKRVAEKPNRFDVRLREFYDKHEQVMRRELAAPMAACFNGDGGQRLESLVKSHIAESIEQILGVCDCQADELAARIDERVSTWHNERPAVTP